MKPAYEGSTTYAIHAARGKRIALAGSIRSALLQLEKTPQLAAANFKAQFEIDALQRALAVLLEPPPTDRLIGAELEIDRATTAIDRLGPEADEDS